MQNVQPHSNISDAEDKKSLKRHLARQLIQHIMSFIIFYPRKYSMALDCYELYNIAKKRVQTDHISSIEELNTWFQKLSINLREKVNQLSGGLISHFDKILEDEFKSYNQQMSGNLQLTKDQMLVQKQLQRIPEVQLQKSKEQALKYPQGVCISNESSSSIYEKQCPWCNKSIAIEANLIKGAILISIEAKIKQNSNNFDFVQNEELVKGEVQSRSTTSTFVQKTNGGDLQIGGVDSDNKQSPNQIYHDEQTIQDRLQVNQTNHTTHFSKENKPRKSSATDLEEDQMQSGFYGIFLGLLDIFQM